MYLTYEDEYFLRASQYPIFPALSITAFIIAAALYYVASSNEDSSIPLYVPERSTAGNHKKRWMFDSANFKRRIQECENDSSVPVYTHH